MQKPSFDAEERDFDVVLHCGNFFELSPQPMVAVAGETHLVRYFNPAFGRLAGKKRADLIGRPFAEAIPEGEANSCLALLDRVFRTGTSETLEEQQHGESRYLCWSYSVWAILGAQQQPAGAMIQVTDATEVAAFRKQAVAMNEQLLVSATRQHELTATAENANQLKDEFLATLSHELRTPLTVIIGWTEILAHPLLEPENKKRAIDIIRRNARMQALLIDDLLDVSRIITGKLRLNVQAVVLSAIVLAAVDGLRPAAQAKGITFQWHLDAPASQVSGDADRLQQVAWNLLSNALKFTPEGGQIVVRLANVAGFAELTISDTGQGIAPEFLPHVFDRFRQADASSTRTLGGLGLGLSIVRQLVEFHGGTVRVDSEGLGSGATFSVRLPLITVPVFGSDARDLPAPPLQLTEFSCPPELKNLRVLVVDDEADTCDLLQLVLEECGAHVKTANSVVAALQWVVQEEFDVLISDIGMPGEDGYSLLAKVRAMAQYSGAKIPLAAALTAYVGEKDRLRVLKSGFEIHVPKPITPHELIAVVANLASRTG